MQPTRGTLRSALGMLAADSVVYEDGDWRPAPLRPPRARFPFPAPVGTQPVMHYPSGEVLTVPRHVRTRKVTSLITVETIAGTPKAAPLDAGASPRRSRSRCARRSAACSSRCSRATPRDRRGVPRARSASRSSRSRTARTAAPAAASRPAATSTRLTAATAVHGAALMAEPGYDRVGVLSPASAYDAAAFLDALAPHGVAYEIA